MTYETLQQAIGNKTKFEITGTKEFTYKGKIRTIIKIIKTRSKKSWEVIQYENGRFSQCC